MTLKSNLYSSIRSNYTDMQCQKIKLSLAESYRTDYANILN